MCLIKNVKRVLKGKGKGEKGEEDARVKGWRRGLKKRVKGV